MTARLPRGTGEKIPGLTSDEFESYLFPGLPGSVDDPPHETGPLFERGLKVTPS